MRSGHLGGSCWYGGWQLKRQLKARHAGKRRANCGHASVMLGMAGLVVRQ
ncbi:hypothetical protein EMGBS3_15340 [Anaerolineaceae bacterium]|nr:hypothetical protein EMGBS3_15340 [Anaerolineaceae bacterium]